MRTGILGGTFDPPHIAHLILADEACHQLGLQRLLWVLTPDPPHKHGLKISPVEQRLELLTAAIEGNPLFEVSRVEMDRPGPHYALDTLRLLRNAHPRDELFYLVGGDSLHDLPTWHEPQKLLDAMDFLGVMRRPDDHVDMAVIKRVFPGIEQKLRWVDAPLLEISATGIRSRIASGKPYRYYLPQSVYELIRLRDYYRQP